MSEVLLQAVRANLIDEVPQLITEGANVNYRNADGMTALMEATLNLNIPMMTLLLDVYHADVHLEDNQGQTALNHVYLEHLDAEENILPIINLLLTYHANPSHMDATRGTLLQWAAFNGHCQIARRMLEAGCEAETAIEDAYEGGDQEMIDLLENAIQPFMDETSEIDDEQLYDGGIDLDDSNEFSLVR